MIIILIKRRKEKKMLKIIIFDTLLKNIVIHPDEVCTM